MTAPKRTPLFQFIAQALRGDIAEGAYPPGAKLPAESALADRFGVNRHTVRHALQVLAGEGLVRSRRGSGTVVVGRPIDYRLGTRVRFHQNLLAAGLTPDKKVLSVDIREATADDARILKLPQGAPVCVYAAVSFADGAPMAMAESRFPEHRLPGLAAALGRTSSITAALAEVGVADYTRASTRLSAERATPDIALHLGLSEGDPLLHTSSVNVDADGRVVEFGRTWFAGSRVVLTIDREAFAG
ncbi:MAG: phosphonate metabolism transcriptional regulator PhnF [Paracoccaceae bacterium]|nr:phosphonate metabolism transcriptional regulator PhnF [Paracoccaceae bacterium]